MYRIQGSLYTNIYIDAQVHTHTHTHTKSQLPKSVLKVRGSKYEIVKRR